MFNLNDGGLLKFLSLKGFFPADSKYFVYCERSYYMCDQNFVIIENCRQLNVFIKLLILANSDDDFTLLYGFSIPTKQEPFSWRFRDTEAKKQSIWSAVYRLKKL